jgi:hypothetical protein
MRCVMSSVRWRVLVDEGLYLQQKVVRRMRPVLPGDQATATYWLRRLTIYSDRSDDSRPPVERPHIFVREYAPIRRQP